MTEISDRCSQCAVRDSALCAVLRDDEIGKLSDIGRRRVVAKGQVLVWSGDPSTICANLVSGVIKLAKATADGREQTVGLLFPGDFVGEPFAQDARLTATALSEADLCIYPRAGFEDVLEAHPQLERMLLRRTLDSLEAARERMLTLARKSASEKVAGFLLDILDKVGGRTGLDGAIVFDLPLSRGEMADVLGLTIETVSRQLSALKADGVIALPSTRSVVLLDRRGLEAISDER